jgi:predicted acetyltransferase
MAGEPTAYEIVPVTPELAEDFLAVDQAAFFFEHSRPAEEAMAALDLDRCYAATRTGGPPFAGIYGSFDMTVTIPAPGGGLHPVPMAGLTWVGVHPDERRRGVLSRMVRHHFADLHRQGAAVSGLHASEPAIYGRFGYAVASLDAFVTLSRGQALHAPAFEQAATAVTTRMVAMAADGVAARVHDLHVRFMGAQLGGVVRTPRMTHSKARDFPPERRGREASQVLFAERDGQPVGYALLHRKDRWEDGRPQGAVTCHEMAAADPAALLALSRRLVDFDLTSAVKIESRSLDDPLLWWAGGPRAASVKVYDGAWLRLVDVGAALRQRGCAAAVDTVIEVVDPTCPWNEGRWRLRCEGPSSAATCERTEDAADVRLPVQVLGSAYAGLRTISAQAAQGVVEELTEGAVAALSSAFATDRQPVAAVMF